MSQEEKLMICVINLYCTTASSGMMRICGTFRYCMRTNGVGERKVSGPPGLPVPGPDLISQLHRIRAWEIRAGLGIASLLLTLTYCNLGMGKSWHGKYYSKLRAILTAQHA